MSHLMLGSSAAALTAWLFGGGGGPPIWPTNEDPFWSKVILLQKYEAGSGTQNLATSGYTLNAGSSTPVLVTDTPFPVGHSMQTFGGGVVGDTVANWLPGVGDWTIEAWYKSTNPAASGNWVMECWDGAFDSRSLFYISLISGKLAGGVRFTSNGKHEFADTVDFPTNTWQHVCLERAGAKIRLYRNGLMVASYTHGTPTEPMLSVNESVATFRVGDGSNVGYIDEVRYTRGVARYNSDTSYPIPDAPFPTTGNAFDVDAAHPCWRAKINTNNGGGWITITRVEMYTSRDHKNQCLGGRSMSDDDSGANPSSMAFDENYNNTWALSWTVNHWIGYTLPVPKVIVEFGIRAYTNGTETPKDFDIQCSDDGVMWFTKWSVAAATGWYERQMRFFRDPDYVPAYTGSPWGTHTRWRFIPGRNGGSGEWSCAETEMRATPGGADQATGGTASSLTNYPGETPANAFDNNISTVWSTQTGGAIWDWLQYQFTAVKSLVQFIWTSRGDGFVTQNPLSGLVQYSDDNVAWNSCWEWNNAAAWSLSEVRTFTDPNYLVTPAGYETVFLNTGGSKAVSGLSGNTWRTVVPPGSQAARGATCRVTFKGGDDATVIGDAFIGVGGSGGQAWQFTATITRITFAGGAHGVTIPIGGSVTSDPIAFAITGSDVVVISHYQTGGNKSWFFYDQNGIYGRHGGGNQAGTIGPVDFLDSGQIDAFIVHQKLEVGT